jgi:hypothetical protein
VDAEALCSERVNTANATKLLDGGQPLTEWECRWVYVPGLTLNDDPELAVAWDKSTKRGPMSGVPFDDPVIRVAWSFKKKESDSSFNARQQTLLAARDDLAKSGEPVLVDTVTIRQNRG